MVNGVAASIRASQENETFDLGGQNAGTIRTKIRSAFKDPFPLQEMIRITFVTGAGKQARQKYDDGAAKAVTSILKEYGYDEDRGASCVMACAGSFKLQHDTGKNLKTVVVFPKVLEATSGGKSGNSGSATGKLKSLIPESSPEYKLAVSSLSLFQKMISSRCPSWSQKKGCLGGIEKVRKLIESLEATLMKGTPLSDSKQAFYDSVVGLHDKEDHLRQELQEHVETGNLTKFELELLRTQNAERIAALQKEGKSTAKALERKELLQKVVPIPPEKLRNHAQIGELRKELQPLQQVEERSKGRYLSTRETQAMARKEDILKEISHLEETSRGWFEDENVFLSRLEASRGGVEADALTKKQPSSKITVLGTETKMKVSLGKFVTPGDSNTWSKTKSKKRGKPKAGAIFSAMTTRMDDSDDDEDKSLNNSSTRTGNGALNGKDTSKKMKMKKKKQKPKQKQENNIKEEQTWIMLSPLRNSLLSFLDSLLGSIIAIFFGKPRKRHAPKKKFKPKQALTESPSQNFLPSESPSQNSFLLWCASLIGWTFTCFFFPAVAVVVLAANGLNEE